VLRIPDRLTLAVRVFPDSGKIRPKIVARKFWRAPKATLVFDTETTTDATQRMKFGSYRFVVDGKCLEEGIFVGDDLPACDRKILEHYMARHSPDVHEDGHRTWLLLSRVEFLEKLYKAAYKGRCLLVGFNLPFDLSRLAVSATSARGRFAGGFSLVLWTYRDEKGKWIENRFRPRVFVKQIDNKRALKGFTSRRSPDSEDIVFDEAESGKDRKGSSFRGHLVDLRTLAFALTDKSYSLATLCEDFGVEHRKATVAAHGEITDDYINYNRRDVLSTLESAEKLLAEYARHPINLQPTKAYSPASIGKAYLKAMGIKPILDHQTSFPKQYLGFAQTSFFGGRTSAKIRKVAMPVVYSDFLSMYPTVNSLMGLWRFVTAQEVSVVANCKSEIDQLLRRLTPDDLFRPETWKLMNGFVKVLPDGDILPSRAKYNAETNGYQVAVNYLYAENSDPLNGMWWSLPDVLASVLLTGRIPLIVDAFRIVPRGVASGLSSTDLRGAVRVDPAHQDFFKVVIEERKRPSRSDLYQIEKKRLDKALKVLANAASYGIYAEMNRQETEEKVSVRCYGIDSEPYTCRVAHPDNPGEFCFPPLASLITGGARLMLALLEHCVTELGGTYAMEDTDSMAIVATQGGGLIPCQGGPYRIASQNAALRSLSFKQVDEISNRFAALNPYSRDAIPGSILKIEDDNFDPQTGKQRQLYCYAISAKRYALFLIDDHGEPSLLREGINNKTDRWSEHGLGHLLNPINPENEDREWIAQAWLRIIRKGMSLKTSKFDFEHAPAVGRLSISSPAVLKPLAQMNAGKTYPGQLKPFNFLLSCHVSPFGHPTGTDAERFHLITSYESDPRKWHEKEWIDQYSGETYRITTTGQHGTRQSARIKTIGEILIEYEFHSESKCADSAGAACTKQTVGLLQRRHIQVALVKYIGKESNSLEDVESGLVHSAKAVYTEYSDPRRDEWQTKILPVLKKVSLALLVEKIDMSRRALIDARAGRSRPHRRNQSRIISVLRGFGLTLEPNAAI
jgi:hypothetical protein